MIEGFKNSYNSNWFFEEDGYVYCKHNYDIIDTVKTSRCRNKNTSHILKPNIQREIEYCEKLYLDKNKTSGDERIILIKLMVCYDLLDKVNKEKRFEPVKKINTNKNLTYIFRTIIAITQNLVKNITDQEIVLYTDTLKSYIQELSVYGIPNAKAYFLIEKVITLLHVYLVMLDKIAQQDKFYKIISNNCKKILIVLSIISTRK